MKIIKKILYILVAVLLTTSCIDDTGSYDYVDIADVDFSKIPSELKAVMGKKLFIKGDIVTTLDDADLEFIWYFYSSGVFDTISNEKDLDVFVDFEPGEDRNLQYSVYDTKNKVHYFKGITLDVITPFSTGWAILKDKDGKTEMDFISISMEGTYYKDILATFVKEPDVFKGKPVSLSLNWSKYTPWSQIIIVTEYGGAIIDAFSMKVESSIFDKFVRTDYIDLDLPFTGGYTPSFGLPVLIANGRLYIMSTHNDRLTGMWDYPAKGDYYAAGNVGVWHSHMCMILFDKKNRKYIYLDGGYYTDFDKINEYILKDDEYNIQAFDPNDLGMDCIWIGHCSSFMNAGTSIHVLKDDVGTFYIQTSYIINKNFSALSQTEIEDGLLSDNSAFAVDYVQPYVYMSNGSTIHRFNHVTEGIQPNYLTVDGNITKMISSYDSKMLAVVVDNGTGTKVLILDLENDGAVLETYEVDSKVVDIKYKEDI